MGKVESLKRKHIKLKKTHYQWMQKIKNHE
jgi:hypothetical protein